MSWFRFGQITLVVVLAIGLTSALGPASTIATFSESGVGSANFSAASNFNKNTGTGYNNCQNKQVDANVTGPAAVAETSTATLDGKACQKNGQTPSYTWSIISGSSYATLQDTGTLSPTVDPKSVNQDQTVFVQIEACKNQNQCATDTHEITITNDN